MPEQFPGRHVADRPNHRGVLAALLLAMLWVTSCTVVVNGAARPAPGVKGILLDNDELTTLIGQSFRADPNAPRHFGSDHPLRDFSVMSPLECAGVVHQLSTTTYQRSKPQSVAEEVWWNAGSYQHDHLTVVGVFEAVAALSTAQAADAVFATAVQQWQGCSHKTVVDRSDRYEISDVRLTNSVLAATVAADFGFNDVMQTARAVGVRAKCVVEVIVPLFDESPRKTAAIDVAHMMMNKIGAVSSDC